MVGVAERESAIETDGTESSEAFGRLSDRAIDRCYSLAGYLLGDAAEAQDVTQETMIRAWRARASLRREDAFEGWLDRILVNTCIDRMRRRKAIQFVDVEGVPEIAARDPFRDLLSRDELGRALDVLTPEQRTVVVLRFWRDLSVDEIASRMGCPSGTVKSRLHNAIVALRTQLQRDAREVAR